MGVVYMVEIMIKFFRYILPVFLVAVLLFVSSCYTRLTHPEVSYVDKLGVTADSAMLDQLKDKHSEVNFNDDCKKCHSDYQIDKYYSPYYSSDPGPDGKNPGTISSQNRPWWRSSAIYSQEEVVERDDDTPRSRRSYGNSSSSSSGETNYLAPPGVLPSQLNVGGGSTTAPSNANTKSSTKKLPTRQKDPNTTSNNNSASDESGESGEDNDETKSTNRRR